MNRVQQEKCRLVTERVPSRNFGARSILSSYTAKLPAILLWRNKSRRLSFGCSNVSKDSFGRNYRQNSLNCSPHAIATPLLVKRLNFSAFEIGGFLNQASKIILNEAVETVTISKTSKISSSPRDRANFNRRKAMAVINF